MTARRETELEQERESESERGRKNETKRVSFVCIKRPLFFKFVFLFCFFVFFLGGGFCCRSLLAAAVVGLRKGAEQEGGRRGTVSSESTRLTKCALLLCAGSTTSLSVS